VTFDSPSSIASPTVRSIDYRHLSWAARLVCDYCHDFERLRPFFEGSPLDPDAWRQAIKARQANPVNHPQIKAAVMEQLTSRRAPDAALASAEQLSNPATVAIVAGQQAGLFGGPLFTLLKGLTAIAVAREVSVKYSVPAVPVFWVHAEDHDLAEISNCSVLTSDFEFETITIPHDASSSQPASAVRLNESIVSTLNRLRELLPNTEFSDSVFNQLSNAYQPGRGIVDAFALWMDTLLGPHGLVVFDASDTAVKSIARPLFQQEIDTVGETSRLATESGSDLIAKGYHAQVTPSQNSTGLFYLSDSRQAIRLNANERTPERTFDIDGKILSLQQINVQLANNPDAFSPNVLLRPIVQDKIFPTIATIAGPSELAYLGQLRQVYNHFDIPMPIIYPRASATIMDQATLRFMERYDVSFEMLQAQDDGVLNRLLSNLLPDEVDKTIEETKKAITDHLAAVSVEVAKVDPTLVGAVETTKDRMDRDLKKLGGKIIQAAKRRDETLQRQFRRARSQSFPNGDPQERAINCIYFLNRYGLQMVDHVIKQLPLKIGQHGLITV